jgi:hypothetical protein
MKKLIYALILPLVVVSGMVFANLEISDKTTKKSSQKPIATTKKNNALKKCEATPDGQNYKKWQASPEGQKVYAKEAKIRNNLSTFSNMEATVTSLSLPSGARLGFGLMVKINGEDYILSFGPEKFDKDVPDINKFQQLHNLKVDDNIIIKSHTVSHAPKYSYPIVSGDYVEQDGKVIYKRAPQKGGC